MSTDSRIIFSTIATIATLKWTPRLVTFPAISVAYQMGQRTQMRLDFENARAEATSKFQSIMREQGVSALDRYEVTESAKLLSSFVPVDELLKPVKLTDLEPYLNWRSVQVDPSSDVIRNTITTLSTRPVQEATFPAIPCQMYRFFHRTAATLESECSAVDSDVQNLLMFTSST